VVRILVSQAQSVLDQDLMHGQQDDPLLSAARYV
jgi:hypothetical protein